MNFVTLDASCGEFNWWRPTWPGSVFERQIRPVRAAEKPQPKGSTTGGHPLGHLLFTLGLHGAILEGRAQAEASTVQWTWQPSTFTMRPLAVPTKPRRSSSHFKEGQDDRGLQLNAATCERVRAKLLPTCVHLLEAPTGWTVRRDKCFALYGLEETHDPTRPPPVSGHCPHPLSVLLLTS